MSNEMKMSDVFNGKVVVDSSSGAVGGGCVEIGDNNGWIAHFGVYHERDINESNELAIYVSHAVNNHDRLVEENSKLREALKECVEALDGSYDVTEWSANGQSRCDIASNKAKLLLIGD